MPAKKVPIPFMANRPSEHILRKNAIELSSKHPLGTISIAKLCRKSHISRRAFYNQYSSMSDFYAHCKRDFEYEVSILLVELIKSDFSIKVNIMKILTFVKKYHILFRSTLLSEDFSLLAFLIQSTKPLIIDEWREEILANKISYTKQAQTYRTFAFQLAEKMDIWIRWQDCTEAEMPKLQKDILELIEYHKSRLRMESIGSPSKNINT